MGISHAAPGAPRAISTEVFWGNDWEGRENADDEKPFMTIEASQECDLKFAKSRGKAVIEIVRSSDWVEKRSTVGA